MSWQLSDVEVRVLGALIEKDMATPEYYPLSLNALVNACNQKSNRNPVVEYGEDTVARAIGTLQEKRLAAVLTGRDHRVPKYRHWAWETLGLGRREMALLAVLLLRGPQTLGELKERSHRMYAFDDLASAESCLQKLIHHEPEPLAVQLPRQPGTREPRYAHLLSRNPVVEEAPASSIQSQPPTPAPEQGSSGGLELRVSSLEEKLTELEREFARFRQQFE